jgi:hypothetical protein
MPSQPDNLVALTRIVITATPDSPFSVIASSGVSTLPARTKLSNLDSSYLKLSHARPKLAHIRPKFAHMIAGSLGGVTEEISHWY